MQDTFLDQLYEEHNRIRYLPSPDEVCLIARRTLQLLFPEWSGERFHSLHGFKLQWDKLKQDYISLFQKLEMQTSLLDTVNQLFSHLPEIKQVLEWDAQAILEGDPASKDLYEVKQTYPGFTAIAYHRMAHLLHSLKVPYCPRVLSEDAHSKTGIDIHPNAAIGHYFCIDHGTGIVIGETVNIGNHVKIYQNVTLGALSVDKKMASQKRHPTIEDHVVIYAGATILGGDTVVGEASIIGGNVWLTKSIPPRSKIYYQPNIIEHLEKADTSST